MRAFKALVSYRRKEFPFPSLPDVALASASSEILKYLRKLETKEQIIGKIFSFSMNFSFSLPRNHFEIWITRERNPQTCYDQREIPFSDTFIIFYHAEGVFVFLSLAQHLFKNLLALNAATCLFSSVHKWFPDYMWIHASVGRKND